MNSKWALLIGINEYKYTPQPGFENLDGCLNDVKDVRSLLIGKYEFPPAHITILENQAATRSGILEAIRTALVDKAAPGDIVVLFYSGHGSEASAPGRINDRDQTIVPHDARDSDGLSADITGTEVNAALALLRTSNSTFIFDSCHSGTMRARKCTRARSIPPSTRLTVPRDATQGGLRPPSATYALLAAAAPNELSFETQVDGNVRGLLTYYLCRELRRVPHVLTYRDLMDNLRAMVAAEEPNQHPQLEGVSADMAVFGDLTMLAQPYILASPEENGVALEAGRELGLTAGSIFEIHSPGTKQFDSSQTPVAKVQLATVSDFHCVGSVLCGGPVEPNSRAVEIEHKHEFATVHVNLEGCAEPVASALRAMLGNLSSVEESNGRDGDIFIRSVGAAVEMEQPGGIRPISLPQSPTLADKVTTQIIAWTRWLGLLRLSNANSNLDVDFTIAPVPDVAGSYFDDGAVECTIRNRSAKDLYLTLLNFGDDGSIRIIYPSLDPSLLYSGRTLQKRFEFEPLPAETKIGREVLKLFATTMQQDFRIVEMTSVKSAPAGGPLDALLLGEMGCGARGNTATVRTADWTAREQGFTYRAAAERASSARELQAARS